MEFLTYWSTWPPLEAVCIFFTVTKSLIAYLANNQFPAREENSK